MRVIRTFRPDVIVTRFALPPANTHGHHTASAVLAVEAFKLAGDPKAFPEQIAEGLAPWQPKRIVLNAGGGGRGGNILSERFLANDDFKALYETKVTELRERLIASGDATDSLNALTQLLLDHSSVDDATITKESDAIAQRLSQ